MGLEPIQVFLTAHTYLVRSAIGPKRNSSWLNRLHGPLLDRVVILNEPNPYQKENEVEEYTYTHRYGWGATWLITKLPSIHHTENVAECKYWNDRTAPYTHTVYKWRNYEGLRQNLSRKHYTAKPQCGGVTFDFEKVKVCAEAQPYAVLRIFRV